MPEASTKFEIRAVDPDRAVLSCTGGLSWEDRDVLADEVGRFLEQHPAVGGLVLDLGAVPFVNSASLGALFQLVGRLRARRGRLAFANIPPLVARMFTAVGMDRLAGIAGRIGTFEILLAGDETRDMIGRGASAREIYNAAAQAGMMTIAEAGKLTALRGLTTIEELMQNVSEIWAGGQ